jgi:hypothetical protein
MNVRRPLQILPIVGLLVGCVAQERARTDSIRAVTEEQLALTTTLSAQKDSLARVVMAADDFIMAIDSQIRTVKGLPAPKRVKKSFESPIAEQIERRKEVLARVNALVQRAKTTATQLADARELEKTLRGEKETLEHQLTETTEKLSNAEGRLTDDHSMIAELSETIERQTATIASLELRVDSLVTETRTMGATHYRAYYIVGTERELLQKGVIEREGGANLLIAHPGRTLQPARSLDPTLFTPIDQREVHSITVPDSTKRYRVVSRQNLDKAVVADRDKSTFKGNVKIAEPDQFWAGSRYLILVQR